MLRTILIGLDASPYSSAAVELGIRWARRFDASLVGLGIIDEPTILGLDSAMFGKAYVKYVDEPVLADARRHVDQILERFATRCAGADVTCEVLEDVGQPSEQILQEAQCYDLILLGQQTYFHFETRDRADETLWRVVKNSPRPVVVVPEALSGGDAIVVAYDGSLEVARTLYAFQETGLGASREVHVIGVDADHQEAARRADRAVRYLRHHEITATSHPLVSTTSPAELILEQVRQWDAGLVVAGLAGKPTLREFFVGSMSHTLLKESPVPLLLYH
jgi:nucleotide-binding universal stress UspA family protein